METNLASLTRLRVAFGGFIDVVIGVEALADNMYY
jgi:hypothetical protein